MFSRCFVFRDPKLQVFNEDSFFYPVNPCMVYVEMMFHDALVGCNKKTLPFGVVHPTQQSFSINVKSKFFSLSSTNALLLATDNKPDATKAPGITIKPSLS